MQHISSDTQHHVSSGPTWQTQWRRETWWIAGKTDRNDSGLWLPLFMHLRDTAGIMGYLARVWIPEAVRRAIGLEEETLNRTAKFLGLTHDIGKAIPLFQGRVVTLPEEARTNLGTIIPGAFPFLNAKKTPHARASEAILLELGCPPGLASIAGAHHGKPQEDGISPDRIRDQIEACGENYLGKPEKPEWRVIWQDLLTMALQESGFASVEELSSDLSISGELILTGLLIMADWIASNTTYFPLISVEENGRESEYPGRIRRALEKLRLPDPWEGQYPFMGEGEFQERFGFLPYAAQSAVMQAASSVSEPGLMILEAQMGAGKTEAALAAAEIFAARFQEGGIFFGLPTQATANGIFGRLKSWAEEQSQDGDRHSINLAHSMAALNEEYRELFEGTAVTEEDQREGGLIVHSWFRGSKQALLANFVIGTVDQLLMAALKQNHVMLRHLGLAGKVVIIDECHAYDAYMNVYLDRALNWLGKYRVPVILLSATLPAKRRAELIDAYRNVRARGRMKPECTSDYPLLTYTDGEEIRQEVLPISGEQTIITLQKAAEEDLPAILRERMEDGGCAGIIVNTVKRAQALSERIKEGMPDFEVVLFHSQFLMPDRAEIEKKLLERLGKRSDRIRRDRLIVIGTQVLEQSLDIDFDFMVTELCPMDLLLQRIGRLHRHKGRSWRPERLRQATCCVLDTQEEKFDEGSRAVYGEWLLWRTRMLLPEKIVLPDDISPLVQKTYDWETADGLEEDEASLEAKERYEFQEKKRKRSAKNWAILRPGESRGNTLDNWMAQSDIPTDAIAQAAVRDGDPAIDVLVMVRHKDGSIRFLPWQEEGKVVDAGAVPSQEESRQIARQRLRLPGYFSRKWEIHKAISDLEEQNRRFVGEWQKAPILKGELILLLDSDGNAHIAGAAVHYDREKGLTYRKEDIDEGDRV